MQRVAKKLSFFSERLKHRVSAYVVLLLALTSTWFAWHYSAQNIETVEQARFEDLSGRLATRIATRLQLYINVLNHARGLFHAKSQVTREDFQNYLHGIDIANQYPGVESVGYIKTYQPSDMKRYFNEKHFSGHNLYSIWPFYKRNSYTSILFLQPENSETDKIVGFDMSTDPEAKQAMDQARDSGSPTLSSQMIRTVNKKSENYFLVFVPVFNRGQEINTVAQRRKAIAGYIFSTFKTAALLEKVVNRYEAYSDEIIVSVFDTDSQSNLRNIYSTHNQQELQNATLNDSNMVRNKFIQVGGRMWAIQVVSEPNFRPLLTRSAPILIIIFGCIVAVLLFSLFSSHFRYSENLKASEDQLTLVINSIPALISYVDKNERFIFINKTYEEWLGVEQSQIKGKPLKEVIGSKNYENVKHQVAKALKGYITEFETVLVDHNNNEKNVRVVLCPQKNYKGQVCGYIGLTSDISGLRKTEAELKSAKEAAEAASQAKTNFLANISHEIRTPLGAIIGFSDLALEDNQTEQERLGWLSKIRRNARHLANLIEDLLDISKIEAGRINVEPETFALTHLIADLNSLLGAEALSKSIRLRFIVSGGIPRYIKSDRLRLRQILINLIGNALKFSDHGLVEVTISHDWQDTKSYLKFNIKDQGLGIKADQFGKLFKPFSQADGSSRRKYGGTGLGLALSRKLARALGGDIELLESKPGRGSTFAVYIETGLEKVTDLVFDLDVEKQTEKLHSSKSEDSELLKDLHILVVEDSVDNQILISRYLHHAGATVEIANNGREGVQKALSNDFDLILMDLQMPEVDGYQATQELRESGFTKPILALTAHAFKEELEKCITAGCNDHFFKPIERKKLIQGIYNWVSNQPTNLPNINYNSNEQILS